MSNNKTKINLGIILIVAVFSTVLAGSLATSAFSQSNSTSSTTPSSTNSTTSGLNNATTTSLTNSTSGSNSSK